MSGPVPSLEEVLHVLLDIAGVDTLDPDVPIRELDVDSLDLAEWLTRLEQLTGLALDDANLIGLQDRTIREVYDHVMALGAVPAEQQP